MSLNVGGRAGRDEAGGQEKPQMQSGLELHGLSEVKFLGQRHTGSGGPRIHMFFSLVKRGQ